MKTVFVIICLTILNASLTTAQSATTETYPYWTISKGVKQLPYRNLQHVPSTIYTGNGTWTVSKEVQKVSDANTQKRKVKKGGNPGWIISKGAARFQATNSK
jgi:hypothetical protein